MAAHCMVYRLPFNTPRKGNNSGSTFNTSHDPPGRNGATLSSQTRQRIIKPNSVAAAVYRSAGLSGVVILVLLPGMANRVVRHLAKLQVAGLTT